MVYCGKPSKGCQSCRDRKTRCDKALPSCSQCIRAGRQCPGYRSQLDLMFRNESTAVIDKAKSREKAKSKARSEASQPTSVLEPKSEPSDALVLKDEIDASARFRLNAKRHEMYVKTHIPNILHSVLFPTIEERSLGYFTTNFPVWFRHFDLVDTICAEANGPDEHLLASMSAVGLASFSNSVQAPELMIRARRDYGTALQLTNAALRNPAEVKKDSTLFAVMILSVFETVTGNTERSLTAWTEHVNGAAALVKLRGEDQFTTQAGQRLFLQVTSNLLLSCIQRTLPMPHHIMELRKSAERYMDADSVAWQINGIIIDVTILRAAVRDGSNMSHREVVDASLEIESRFVDLFSNLPIQWQYQTVYTDENPHLIWNGSYQVYNEFGVSNVWNAMRTCRILLHDIIRNQLLLASYCPEPIFSISEILSQNESSEAIMIMMRDGILGSVPQQTQSLSSLPSDEPCNNGLKASIESSRNYAMLWPLYLAGAMDLTTIEIRDWAIQRLKDIGTTVGLRQASVVADHLATGRHIEAWDREGNDFQKRTRPARAEELSAFFDGLKARQAHEETQQEIWFGRQGAGRSAYETRDESREEGDEQYVYPL